MANPIWVTPAGSLGLVPEAEYFQVQLQVTNPAVGDLIFIKLSGEMPPGIQVSQNGYIQGVPIITDEQRTNNTYQFSVRARNILGEIADRTFSLTVTNIVPPQITPREQFLGDFFDGGYYSKQLFATNVNPETTLEWRIQNGSLPEGVTLDPATGLISGFIYPLPAEGSTGLSGYDETRYNQYGYDNSSLFRNKTYIFTVSVFDGANYDTLTYTLNVTAKSSWSADTTENSINDSYLTVDTTDVYAPIITTPPQSLPNIRSDSNFAFKFEAIDPEGDAIQFGLTAQSGSNFDLDLVGFDTVKFDQSGLDIPPGLSIDPDTGWMTGFIPLQAAVSLTYTFEVYAYKRDNPSIISETVTYSLTVLGDINNTITWYTASDLGIIDNGSVSELSIVAVSNLGKTLEYSLTADGSRLPQGLQLLPSGLISGRASFEYFTIDSGATVIDGTDTTFDNTYTFTVSARDFAETVYDTRQFTITINNYDLLPYENLYITALPKLEERLTFLNIVNNRDIFPDELIYRPTDPWFGRAKNIRSLFLAGINPTLARDYIASMSTNHFTKSIEFGNIKTARALDSNFNVKYEVVYLDLVDSTTKGLELINPVTKEIKTPSSAVDLTGAINPWLDSEGNGYTVVYPNNFDSMLSTIVDNQGYAHQGELPDWMTSPQENNKPLGFVNAVVLAHTVPGASKLIAYRLSTRGLQFNDIDFVVDRYQLDNHLSTNYDISINSFISSKETTWDRVSRVGSVLHSVKYAVFGLPFDNINNKTVNFIRGLGGLDDDVAFEEGDTLIFYQQEGYDPTNNPFITINANEGWNYPDGSVVPGFLEKDRGLSAINYRAGVWRIRISTPEGETVPSTASDFGNNLVGFDTRGYDFTVDWINPGPFPNQIVTLEFVEEVIVGSQVQINGGETRGQSIVFYDPVAKPGRGVPEYSPVTYQTGVIQLFTKFDNEGTKFFNNRDTYAAPEQNNKYLKFPKFGVFK